MFYNWNVIGHEKELAQIEQDFLNNNLHHAYLLVGPDKIGKFRVARAMAAMLQCPNKFCHSCPTCIQIDKKCHADTIAFEDDGESIKILEIRETIARLNMTGQSAYKILLIEEIGRLTPEAGNCLLKILEEPPQKTIFIFTASQLQDILPTIASRMRAIYFRKLPDEILRAALQKQHTEVNEETLNQAIMLSLGRSGSAIKLLSDPEMFSELKNFYSQIQFLTDKGTISSRITAVKEISADPQRTKLFLSLLANYLRHKMLASDDCVQNIRLIRIIEKIHEALDLMSRNVNQRLLLENIMIQL